MNCEVENIRDLLENQILFLCWLPLNKRELLRCKMLIINIDK